MAEANKWMIDPKDLERNNYYNFGLLRSLARLLISVQM